MSGIVMEKITDIPSRRNPRTHGSAARKIYVRRSRTKKEAIAETINRLDQHVQRAIDWRAQVGDHPYLALGLAVGVGCLFAGIFKEQAQSARADHGSFSGGR